ncbi:MAG: hypothetical protein O2880_01975 [Proteobacteria bacterium]|nr:hypothetical protein [Pseudomonadota bacterium]
MWRRITSSRSSSAAIHASSAILVALYLGALCDVLRPVSAILLIAGTLLAPYEASHLMRLKEPLPVPLGVLVILCVLFSWFHHDTVLRFYDEYSHWGIYIKDLLSADKLWGADSSAMHLRYLPGAPLWQYLFLSFTKSGESAAFLAQFCLLVLPLLVLWQNIRWQQVSWILAVFALIALVLSNFGHGFVSLYVDHVLGAWFAGTIFSFMLDVEDRSPRQLLSYLLPIMTLVLIKDSGLYFAVAAIGIMAVMLFWRISFIENGRNIRSGLIRAGSLATVFAVCAVSIATSWNANRDNEGISRSTYSSGGIVSIIASGNSSLDEDERVELRRRFSDVVLHHQISKSEDYKLYNEFTTQMMHVFTDKFRLTTASLILLFALWQIVVLYKLTHSGERWRWVIGAVGLTLTTVAYLGILLLSYQFAFYERGIILPSYVRYAHSALLPMVIFVVLPLVPGFRRCEKQSISLPGGKRLDRGATIFAVILGALYVFETPYLAPLYESREPPPLRVQFDPLTETMRGLVGDGRLWIYVPIPDPIGLVRRLLLYQMTPVQTEVVVDPEFLLQDPSAFEEVFANWDYLWFPIPDPLTDDRLRFLFGEDLKDGVFRIDRTDGAVNIVALDGVFDQSP